MANIILKSFYTHGFVLYSMFCFQILYRFVDSDIGGIADGMRSGPIAVFDETGETLLIASLSNFMSSSMWYESAPSPRMSWGIMGGINNIPQDYGIATIVVHASGINQVC